MHLVVLVAGEDGLAAGVGRDALGHRHVDDELALGGAAEEELAVVVVDELGVDALVLLAVAWGKGGLLAVPLTDVSCTS